jgi:hypothetical protein
MPIRKETYKAVLDAALSIHTIHETMREAIHHALTQEGDPHAQIYSILTTYNIPARELALLMSEHRAQTIRWQSNNRRQQAAQRKRKGVTQLSTNSTPNLGDTSKEGLEVLHTQYPAIWRSLYGTCDPLTIYNLLKEDNSKEHSQ